MLKNTVPDLRNVFLSFLIVSLSFFSSQLLAQDAPDDGIPTDAEIISAGAQLYKNNCTQCHAINEVVIGPALKDVHERQTVEWLIPWIRNSQKVIQSGDEYAVALYEEYNRTVMTAYPFSDDEILSILAYIKDESNKEPVVAEVADGVAAGAEAGGGGTGVSQEYLTAVIIIFVVVLVLILITLVLIISILTKFLKGTQDLSEEDKEVVGQRVNVLGFVKSDSFIGLVAFVFTIVLLKTAIDGAFSIGVQQGYEPTQPIAFSHKIHAGQYEIDCQYCHTGVRKAKSANIPSANICMNCHTAIKTESPEIAKIYEAIDYDPQTGTYGTDTKPIEWIRVHNLPDLAYFNHSQHVQVGGLECQTCHGPIEEMEVVYQHSNLTMGWCINCHRETNLNTKGNGYYTDLVELHSEVSKEPMTVEDNGGLECAKCHY
ncbi:MAG: cytochrome c3 family protein [Bacteroidota bacterium]